VDVRSADTGAAGVAALFVASPGLLMTGAAGLRDVTIAAERHEGTRGGPADRGASWPGSAT
jgi:arylformamidase